MTNKPIEFELLIDAIKSLPGIGSRSAEKIAYFLLNQDTKYIDDFIKRIKHAHEKINYCTQCNNFCTSGERYCSICSNAMRDTKQICVVHTIEDLNKIESTNQYVGLYYVLNEEIDVKKQVNISKDCIDNLTNMINKYKTSEIILATDLTINGEATAKYIAKVLNKLFKNSSLKVYRIGFGLPINSSIEYVDTTSIKYALKNKVQYE